MKRIVIRIYKWHDSDLLALGEYGVSYTRFLKLVLANFANGKRIKYSLPELAAQIPSAVQKKPDKSKNTDSKTKPSGAFSRFTVDIKDPKVLEVIDNIIPKRRNEFCKALMRDSLQCEPLEAFFTDESIISHALSVRQSPAISTTSSLPDLFPSNSAKGEKKVKNKDKKTASRSRKKQKNMGNKPSSSETEVTASPNASNVHKTPPQPRIVEAVDAIRPPSNSPSKKPSAVRRPVEADFTQDKDEEKIDEAPMFDFGEDSMEAAFEPITDSPAVDVFSMFSNMLSEVDNS